VDTSKMAPIITKCYDVICLTPSKLLNLEDELHNAFVCILQVFQTIAANSYSEILKDVSSIFSLKNCQIFQILQFLFLYLIR
jgi:hypothetical protein